MCKPMCLQLNGRSRTLLNYSCWGQQRDGFTGWPVESSLVVGTSFHTTVSEDIAHVVSDSYPASLDHSCQIFEKNLAEYQTLLVQQFQRLDDALLTFTAECKRVCEMAVSIKLPSGDLCRLAIHDGATAWHVKSAFHKESGMTIAVQRLLLCGRVLLDNEMVSDLKLEPGSPICLEYGGTRPQRGRRRK